jgi:hypothetical protein
MADILLWPFFVAWIASTMWVGCDGKPRDRSKSSLATTRAHRALPSVYS